MRLKLVRHAPQPEPGEKGWRLLETGELTLGRASGNDWVLVDPDRRISGTHCRIGRDGKGFWLKDESTNGLSLDGRPLAQGEKVPLRDGSSLEFCGQRFVAEITGELEPDWVEPDHSHIISDEAPSITSILADVSPSGRTASGLIPGRVGDDVFDATPAPSGTMDVFEDRISRTPIGWGGPPEAGVLPSSALLPDDWDVDSSAGSRNEHVVAMSTRVRVPTPEPEPERSKPAPRKRAPKGPNAAEILKNFQQALGELGEDGDEPLPTLQAYAQELRALRSTMRAMDSEMRDLLDELGEEAAPAPDSLDAYLAQARRDRERLVDALRELLRDVDRLEPDAIEQRSAVENDKPGTIRERLNPAATKMRRAWSLLRKTYRGSINNGSPRARFVARLTGTSTPVDDEFEELRPDQPGSDGKSR